MPPQARREDVSSALHRPPACAAAVEPPSLGLERPRAGSISHQPSNWSSSSRSTDCSTSLDRIRRSAHPSCWCRRGTGSRSAVTSADFRPGAGRRLSSRTASPSCRTCADVTSHTGVLLPSFCTRPQPNDEPQRQIPRTDKRLEQELRSVPRTSVVVTFLDSPCFA